MSADLRFFQAIEELPRPGDLGAATVGLERWAEQAAASEDGATADVVAACLGDPAAKAFLAGLFGSSPYLTQLLVRDLESGAEVLRDGAEAVVARVMAGLEAVDWAAGNRAGVMAELRRAKRRAALAIALADVAGQWPLERVTGALSQFADRILDTACRHALATQQAAGRLPVPAEPGALDGSGLIVLAMGKLGAFELNYSSDVDLIVLFDDEAPGVEGVEEPVDAFVRLTRDVVKLLEERTADGYVLRTDLRLRPDPGATPVAMSTSAAEVYYEGFGQNWERAAMIKARPAAGDLAAGERFLAWLVPFVWRRHLDFAAIQDIHSIKRQIVAHRGGGEIAVYGHNLKLGRGGIREIEFFAQTQQLIWGGRDPRLRTPATLDALGALTEAGRVDAAARDELAAAYRFHRRVEHRLQMVADAQTHTLPADEAGLERLAAFLAYPGAAAFRDDLVGHLGRVAHRYADLFEDSPSLAGPGALGEAAGSLVFTGGENDPETVRTLEAMGFRDGNAVAGSIRGWHHGRVRATRSERARQILTELTPRLLAALCRSAQPDQAFRRLDQFVARLPAGIQLFSLFHANPRLLDVVAEIMGSAPVLADHLARHPILLDGLLTRDYLEPLPEAPRLADSLADAFAQARDYQDLLEIARRWNNDRRFQVGLRLLAGEAEADALAPELSDVADTVLGALLPAVERDFARQHGTIGGGDRLAVLAFGKLGSREMTIGSDLDLVLVYDAEVDAVSDGPRPLAGSEYYGRFCQRLIGALTAPTADGVLYEVDMRLRPSGRKGPIASSLAAFARYQAEDAWTWERMALTRARIVHAPPALARRLAEVIRGVLATPIDPAKLLADVADMRARVAAEHAARSPWDVKHRRGGMVDVEFLAQYLQLRHAPASPEVLSTNTADALDRLARAGFLDRAAADELIAAYRLWQRVQALLRLTVGHEIDVAALPEDLKARLVKAGEAVDFADLAATMLARADAVMRHYESLVAAPAKALPVKQDAES